MRPVKDGDVNQLIYPAKNGAIRTTVPVRGPDSLGRGKFWRIHGMPNEDLRVILELAWGLIRSSCFVHACPDFGFVPLIC